MADSNRLWHSTFTDREIREEALAYSEGQDEKCFLDRGGETTRERF